MVDVVLVLQLDQLELLLHHQRRSVQQAVAHTPGLFHRVLLGSVASAFFAVTGDR
jgi:hypothetical protein